MVKKFLMSLALALGLSAQAETTPTEPAVNSICAPTSAANIRMGVAYKTPGATPDIWHYWWCRNSTAVWLNWVPWLSTEWTAVANYYGKSYHGSLNTAGVLDPGKFLAPSGWGPALVLDPNNGNLPIGREHLWHAVNNASQADTAKPLPGPPNPAGTRPEIWVVTPNGASYFRKTSKVVADVVQAYGSGTQLVKTGVLCDHTKMSYSIGTTTKYLPLLNNAVGVTDEVISCIRIQ